MMPERQVSLGHRMSDFSEVRRDSAQPLPRTGCGRPVTRAEKVGSLGEVPKQRHAILKSAFRSISTL